MKCNKCGSEMAEDALFCTECGASLKKEEKPVAAAAVEAAETVEAIKDDEPTSILPHLEEVIADNEEALSLTQEDVQLLNEEPAELLSSSDTIVLPEPETAEEAATVAIQAVHDEPVPAQFPKPEATAAPVNAAPGVLDDNSDTMEIPVQNDSHGNAGGYTVPQQPAQSTPVIPPSQPAQNAAEPAPMPSQSGEQPKARKKVGGGRIFGASLVTIFAVAFMLLFSFMLSLKLGLNGSVIKKRFSKLDADTTLTAQFDGKEL
ncbi:MAG: zinc-ribbon domain-containing protein, partial [Ruminococcus sp.]|nr:zinc-ribbon domain-containing protein [Ruminococcus sp.]